MYHQQRSSSGPAEGYCDAQSILKQIEPVIAQPASQQSQQTLFHLLKQTSLVLQRELKQRCECQGTIAELQRRLQLETEQKRHAEESLRATQHRLQAEQKKHQDDITKERIEHTRIRSDLQARLSVAEASSSWTPSPKPSTPGPITLANISDMIEHMHTKRESLSHRIHVADTAAKCLLSARVGNAALARLSSMPRHTTSLQNVLVPASDSQSSSLGCSGLSTVRMAATDRKVAVDHTPILIIDKTHASTLANTQTRANNDPSTADLVQSDSQTHTHTHGGSTEMKISNQERSMPNKDGTQGLVDRNVVRQNSERNDDAIDSGIPHDHVSQSFDPSGDVDHLDTAVTVDDSGGDYGEGREAGNKVQIGSGVITGDLNWATQNSLGDDSSDSTETHHTADTQSTDISSIDLGASSWSRSTRVGSSLGRRAPAFTRRISDSRKTQRSGHGPRRDITRPTKSFAAKQRVGSGLARTSTRTPKFRPAQLVTQVQQASATELAGRGDKPRFLTRNLNRKNVPR